jgi:hypothetical protein
MCLRGRARPRQEQTERLAGGEESVFLDLTIKNRQLQVFGILQQMPRLKFVNLSFNQLNTPLKNVEVDRNLQWQQLRNLVLNSTYIDWESVQQILDHLPGLEELHLSMNDYNNVNLCDDRNACRCEKNDNTPDESECFCRQANYKNKQKHGGIRKLHFTGNPVDKWKEICKLGYAFPSLESLVLADCPIESLDIEVGDDVKCNRNYERSESECESGTAKESPHDSFRTLKFLNLNSTRLSTWDDIERLSKFPALHCVRVQVKTKYFGAKENCKCRLFPGMPSVGK